MRRLGIIAGILAIAGLVSGVAWWWLRPEGFLVGLHALSDDEALLLIRANYSHGPSDGWVKRVRADGSTVWTTRLSAPPQGAGTRHGLAVGDTHAAVWTLGSVSGRKGLTGLDLTDGSVVWTDPDAEGDELARGPLIDDGVLFTAIRDGDDFALTARDAATGELKWTSPLPTIVRELQIFPSFVVYRNIDWTWIPRGEGPTERAGSSPGPVFRGAACLREVDGQLVGWNIGSETLRPVVNGEVREPLPLELPISFSTTCGWAGDEIVVTGLRTDSMFDYVVARVRPETAEVVWSVDWTGREVARGGGTYEGKDPAWSPLRGDLPDHVVLRLGFTQETDEGHHQLARLDVSTGAFEAGQRHDELLHYEVLRTRSDRYLADRMNQVLAFDEKGRLVAARNTGGDRVRGMHIADKVVWVYAKTWAPHSQLPWEALDLRTLEPTGRDVERLTNEDVLDEISPWIDL